MIVLYIIAFIVTCSECTILTGELPWKKGICKNQMQSLQPNFDAERFFKGRWFEDKSFGLLFSDVARKCITVEPVIVAESIVNLTISEYIPMLFSTIQTHVQLTMEDVNLPRFNTTIPWLGIANYDVQVDLLGTDYDNYALLYSCSKGLGLDGYISEMSFILRRRPEDKSKGLEIRELCWKNGLRFEDFSPIDNSGCPQEMKGVDNKLRVYSFK